VIRVLLVDDHAVVRMGFSPVASIDRARCRWVAEADSGEAACQLYLELKPDVVVMDSCHGRAWAAPRGTAANSRPRRPARK